MESIEGKKRKKGIICPLRMLTIDRYCAHRVQDSMSVRPKTLEFKNASKHSAMIRREI